MNVVGISGSLRTGSTNTAALRQALRFAADMGAETNEVSLKGLDIPMYDEDIASSPTADVQAIRSTLASADLLIIASPEYNYSVPGGLKNAIDWVSKPRNMLGGKVAAIMGASSGPYGTIRMQPHLRAILTALNVFVVPQPQIFIRNAREAFTADGDFIDHKLRDQVRLLVRNSIALAEALKEPAAAEH
jgi:chromate reductase, NAD(P)H dehydrogenase (quinone)